MEMGLGASLAIIVVVGSLWFYPRWEVQQGTEAIASEYRRGRPMAYRVAGVPYGPVRVERGGAGLASAIEVPPRKDHLCWLRMLSCCNVIPMRQNPF